MDGTKPLDPNEAAVGQPPYRVDDPNNVPLATARKRFLEQLAVHTDVLAVLRDLLMPAWEGLAPEIQKDLPAYGWAMIAHLARHETTQPEGESPETIQFCRVLIELARQFHFTRAGDVAPWIMDTGIETIAGYVRRIEENGRLLGEPRRTRMYWVHPIEMFQAYPARTEDRWIHIASGEPERELCSIVIEIPPKQPSESFKQFETRFNSYCRNARKEYVQRLKEEDWRLRHQDSAFTWVDRLALWQAGRSASEIDPKIKTKSDRVKFSQGIKRISDYLQITPRQSKHNPNRRRRH